jgi:toxin ParE1/3/4
MMSVDITDAAWADLLDILRHVSTDSPQAADRLFDELYEKCSSLGQTPLAFPVIDGYEDAGIRRRLHGNYLIIYRCSGKSVEVLHVLHGARDYDELL